MIVNRNSRITKRSYKKNTLKTNESTINFQDGERLREWRRQELLGRNQCCHFKNCKREIGKIRPSVICYNNITIQIRTLVNRIHKLIPPTPFYHWTSCCTARYRFCLVFVLGILSDFRHYLSGALTKNGIPCLSQYLLILIKIFVFFLRNYLCNFNDGPHCN